MDDLVTSPCRYTKVCTTPAATGGNKTGLCHVGKVYNLCRVKTIRVAVVHGYGQLVRPPLNMDEKFYTKIMFQQG